MDEFGILTEAEVKFVQAHDENVRREERMRIVKLLEAQGLEYRPLAEYPGNLIALVLGDDVNA